ncbi:MAG TPA: glycosyltransferase family 4 protein, partial [Clostridia bacterium]|nr:glycosyltransferase family 4 protein [Clostridia bacterium]
MKRRKHYDVACVDVFSGLAFVWAEAACCLLRAMRKPIVMTLHGGNLPEFGRKNPTRVKRLLNWGAAVTCPSHYLCKEMQKFRDDLRLLPNGIDLAAYKFRFPQSRLCRLVWLRAFHHIYNPVMAVRVLAGLRNQGMDVRLTMIGPDKEDGSLNQTQAAAQELGLLQHITFRGAVAKDAVPNELSCGDVFLNTTNFDNTPVSVIEAMACGLPVVSTNVGGIPYLLKHEETAVLVPPDDANAMTQACVRLMQEPDLAARIVNKGREL